MSLPLIDGFKAYPKLFEKTLGELRKLATDQERRSLTVPALGTFKSAYAFDFEQKYDAKLTNGVSVEIRFREDTSEDFEPAKLIAAAASNLTQAVGSLAAVAPNPTPGLLDGIFAAARVVQELRDGALLELAFYLSKVDALVGLLEEADRTLDILKDPAESDLIIQFKNLWDAAIATGESILEVSDVRTYTTPKLMTCGEVAYAVYGNATRGVDILQLNALDDPFAIPAGTTIRYIGLAPLVPRGR